MAEMAAGASGDERASKKYKVGGEGPVDQPLILSDDAGSVYRFSVYNIFEWVEEGQQWTHRDDVVILMKSDLLGLFEAIYANSVATRSIADHSFIVHLAGKRKLCTFEEPAALDTLGLQAGISQGSFWTTDVSFNFELLAISPAQSGVTYPSFDLPIETASSAEAADHLTPTEMAAAEQFRADFEVAAAGNNTWVRKGATFVADKYRAPGWNDYMDRRGTHSFTTRHVMGLLIKADWPFAKAWKYVLQYALLDRTKGASAVRYSTMKKQGYEINVVGEGMSNEQRILTAKKVARSVMRTVMAIGVPELGPKPMTEYEQFVLEGEPGIVRY